MPSANRREKSAPLGRRSRYRHIDDEDSFFGQVLRLSCSLSLSLSLNLFFSVGVCVCVSSISLSTDDRQQQQQQQQQRIFPRKQRYNDRVITIISISRCGNSMMD